MRFFWLSSLALVSSVFADDWTTKQWDVIVVGAGPAGIIGTSLQSLKQHSSNPQTQSQHALRKQTSQLFFLKMEVLHTQLLVEY